MRSAACLFALLIVASAMSTSTSTSSSTNCFNSQFTVASWGTEVTDDVVAEGENFLQYDADGDQLYSAGFYFAFVSSTHQGSEAPYHYLQTDDTTAYMWTNSSDCKMVSVNKGIDQFCIPPKYEQIADVSVAGVDCTVYQDADSKTTWTVTSDDDGDLIPVAWTRHDATMSEAPSVTIFANYQETIANPDLFNVPDFCNF